MKQSLFYVCALGLISIGCQNKTEPQEQDLASYPAALSSKMAVVSVLPAAIAKYQEMITTGKDLNLYNEKGNTIVVQAIEENLIPAVKLLVQAGVDLNRESANGITPLMAVINNANKSIPKILNNGSVIHIELDKSVNENLMTQLIHAGAAVNHANQFNQTPLMVAASLGNPDAVKLLIDQSCDLNMRDLNGMSALAFAVTQGHTDIIKQLLKAEADTNLVDAQGQSPLVYAAESGNLDIVKLLVNADANVNQRDAYDISPLKTARLNGHSDVAKFLVKNGAKE